MPITDPRYVNATEFDIVSDFVLDKIRYNILHADEIEKLAPVEEDAFDAFERGDIDIDELIAIENKYLYGDNPTHEEDK